MSGTHITKSERYAITYMHMAGFSDAAIGRRLNRHRGTISRELARNRDAYNAYHYESAQRLAKERRTQASQRYKLDDSPVGEVVRDGLCQRWSPEQIVGRLKREHRNDPTMRVTHEAIYQWIYRRYQLGEHWHRLLRKRRHRRRSRVPGRRGSKIPGRVGIERRPPVVNRRTRFGDWEADTIEGRKGSGSLVTHVERKSRYVRLGILADKRASTLSRVSCTCLKRLPRKLRRTLTADNGKEFAEFKQLQKQLRLKVYFANPHSPWERGTNENTNGLLRQFFPKGSDFRQVTRSEVAQAQAMLNNRPRKCLNYRTPVEVLNKLPGVALRN